MADDCSRKCCEPKKKVFQGKAFIPDDHIQLISKYFQGANLNLNFTVDDDVNSEQNGSRKSKSKSKKRGRKHRKRKSKRCKCCKCHEGKCHVPMSCCCGSAVALSPKPNKKTCCDQIEPTATAPTNCCCDAKPVKSPPGEPRSCCKVKPSICCCGKSVQSEPEKICCCCGRPCVEKNKEETHSKREKTEKSKTKEKCKSKIVEDGNHQHASYCCKCNERDEAEGSDENLNVKNDTKTQLKKAPKKLSRPKSSSESIKSAPSRTSDQNVKQVYAAKNVSNLENDEVYGRYWYHRPPLENTITHCDDDDYLGPSGYGNDRRLCEEGGPCDGRPFPPNSERFTTVYNALQDSKTGDRHKNATGRCMACKEPMCLLCKMKICECDCDKPNFVICNPCTHRLTPKPPKKPCLPKKPKSKNQPQQANGGCDEAMFLLPLLASMQASMQGNDNFPQCNC